MSPLDSFLKRYGAFIVSFALAFFFVLLARPFPLEKLRELSLWWWLLPVALTVLLGSMFYRYISRKQPGKQDDVTASGE